MMYMCDVASYVIKDKVIAFMQKCWLSFTCMYMYTCVYYMCTLHGRHVHGVATTCTIFVLICCTCTCTCIYSGVTRIM